MLVFLPTLTLHLTKDYNKSTQHIKDFIKIPHVHPRSS